MRLAVEMKLRKPFSEVEAPHLMLPSILSIPKTHSSSWRMRRESMRIWKVFSSVRLCLGSYLLMTSLRPGAKCILT